MNKKILTAAALLVAGTAFANAESITLPEFTDFTWVAGSNATGIGNGPTSTEIIETFAGYLEGNSIDSFGWFGGTGQSYVNNNEISITSDNSFSFKSRPKYSGEYVALGLNLDAVAESITLNFTVDKKSGYSLWSYDADNESATELIANTYVDSAKTITATYDTANVAAGQLFVVWTANCGTGESNPNHESGGTTITVSNISLSYIAAAVPEPSAFGLLAGAGALALVAARRRRKRA